MSQRLSEAAVSGIVRPQLSDEQKSLLTEGDIEGLLGLHAAFFGSTVMAKDEDDDEDDSDADDDTGDGEDDEDDEDDESDDDDGEDDGDDEGDKGKKKPTALQKLEARIQEVSAEAKKHRLKNRDQRNRIAELERELAASKRSKKGKDDDADKDDADDAPEDTATQQQLAAAQKRNEELAIRVEFMANKKHSWKNPKAALKLLDLSEVEIDEDGEIEGLSEAMDQLAKDEPYLLEPKKQAPDKQTRRQGATGQSTGGGRRRKSATSSDKLLAKYGVRR